MTNFKLNPWFVTGYTDAEGSFHFSIFQNSSHSTGWRVKSFFVIGALDNLANRELLEYFKFFFGGGTINLSGNQLYYHVQDLPTLLKVRAYF